jgi:hypothetical protein
MKNLLLSALFLGLLATSCAGNATAKEEVGTEVSEEATPCCASEEAVAPDSLAVETPDSLAVETPDSTAVEVLAAE